MKEIKLKKCKICSQKFVLERFNQQTCDYKCAIQLAKNKQKEKDLKEWKQEKSILKDKLKTLGKYEAEAKKSFQKWIRMRDDKQPCISCGNINPTDWAGGHYFSAGKYSGFIFDERNCHKQCNSHCNKYLSGNLIEYRKGLIKRYGEDFIFQLESISDANRKYTYTRGELIDIANKYKLKLKILIQANS